MPSNGPSASGPAQPGDGGRCDCCGEPFDEDDEGIGVLPDTDYETADGQFDVEDFREAMIRACEFTDNVMDDMVAEALREKGIVTAHFRCWNETTVEFEKIEQHDATE